MKIICIGRNYSEHAKELGNAIPTEPLFFLKPDSSILPKRNPLFIPPWTENLQYEVELVVKISKIGKYISLEHASTYYDQVSLGIDFTARDIQLKLKEKGHPWEKAKGFDGSAVIGRKFIHLNELGGEIQNLNFELRRNEEIVQIGNTKNMIFSVDQIIHYVSQFMTLKIGDLIFTGTPAGVGKVEIDDLLEASLEGQKLLKVDIK